MKGLALQRARQTLGATHRELAEYADVTPNDIVRWEQCEDVPPEFEHELAVALWALKLEAALAASGLPECPVVAAGDEPAPAPEEADALREHLRTCAVCSARERYVRAHVGPPPLRATGARRLGGRVRRFLTTLAHWQRTAARGVVLAAFLGRAERHSS
ncbi:MAG TPA: hypothetical protein VFS40_15530 [Gemmatimonadales bacterium]|nr:hypothetical protein [Gemmatimonadales bacterium]